MDRSPKKPSYTKEVEEIYQRADAICRQDRHVDRDMVVQSLLMTRHSPLDNLNFALMRAQTFKNRNRQHAQ